MYLFRPKQAERNILRESEPERLKYIFFVIIFLIVKTGTTVPKKIKRFFDFLNNLLAAIEIVFLVYLYSILHIGKFVFRHKSWGNFRDDHVFRVSLFYWLSTVLFFLLFYKVSS